MLHPEPVHLAREVLAEFVEQVLAQELLLQVERLMNLLTALDEDLEIVIRKNPRSRKTARISVVAA